jgi:RNA polymerase sigma factor (sigma-70 family)
MYHTPGWCLCSGVATMGAMTHADADAGVDPARPLRWELAATLFQRWRGGDRSAMDDLVRLMTPTLWHVVRAYGVDAALAQDVVQTTWLTLVRRHESIVEPQAVSGWLTTTARREAWRVGRQQRRADPTEVDDLEPHLPTHESAEQTALRDDASRRLWLAVNQLNERCQRLLRVVAFDERPDYARIATDLAMPIGSIGPTRQRCLGKLRAILAEEGEDGRDDDG